MLPSMVRRLHRVVVLIPVLLAALCVPGSGPVEVAAGPTAVRSVKVMTWNACGGNNTSCRFFTEPGALVVAAREHMRNHGPAADAVFLQEICSGHIAPLQRELERHYGHPWDVRFAAIRHVVGDDPLRAPAWQCRRDRGEYGVAVAVPAGNTEWQVRYLPSPDRTEWRVALCARVAAWRLTLCNAHLSYDGDDPTGEYRVRQVDAYIGLVREAGGPVVFGGDLNLPPDSPVLAPAYARFVECAQTGRDSPRGGPGTFYASSPRDNGRTVKVDYLFTDQILAHSCGVLPTVERGSDHRPLWIIVDLPAGG